MAVKGKNNKNSNAYDGNAMSFPPYASLPSVRQTGSPLSREELMQRKQQNPKLNGKKKAVNNKYKTAGGKKRKKADLNRKRRLEKEKRIRKGRDYFYVMRKLVCFIMFLLFALCIGLFAVGYLGIMPEYTSLFVEPDYTPQAERLDTEDEEGNLIPYEDKSEHFSSVDPIFGFLKKTLGGMDLGDSPKYDAISGKVEAGVADMISKIVMTYFPIALLLYIIVALISMVRAFLGMFGKRIYRLFGLSAFWMILLMLIVIIGGVASNMPVEQNLDFGQIVPFLTSAILPSDGTGPTTAAGYGLLAMVALPLVILLLSIFNKKKVPYSIFD